MPEVEIRSSGQAVGSDADAVTGAEEGPVIEVVAIDPAARGARRRAVRMVQGVLSMVVEPVLHAEIKLGVAPDPAVERPAIAEVTLDVNGQVVRAHVAGHTPREAVDLLEPRLRRRLEQRVAHREVLRRLGRRAAWDSGYRAGSAAERPAWPPRPVEDREVVRRKTFSVGELSLDEAAFDLEMLGHDFYLFRELATGADAVLHHRPGGGYGLLRVRPSHVEPAATTVTVRLDPTVVASLSEAAALEHLNITGEPFLVFADPASGRARVVYRRYDGHYGLITPADEPPVSTGPERRAELEHHDQVRSVLGLTP